MKQDMVMPQMGESITEGTIIKWLKKVGDTVDKDEIVLEISTDKVDSEIPTPVAGKIVEVLAKENDTVEVGNVIARIETDAGTQPEEKQSEPPMEREEPQASKEETEPSVEEKKEDRPPEKKAETAQAERKPEEGAGVPAPPAKQESTKFYSPLVLGIARKEGIPSDELDNIDGSGISGRVTKQDVLNYLEQRQQSTPSTPAAATTATSDRAQVPAVSGEGVEIIPMDHIRKKIAEHMVLTVHTAAHVGLYIEVDMLNVFKIRERSKDSFNRKEGIKLTYMPFIAEAVVKTLKEFPLINASLDENNILIKHFINLGIAVDTEQGLIVPVIKNTDALNIVGIARAINDLAERARNRKLKPDDVSGGTFSISNFGVFGTKIGFPLINQPQLAILGVGSLEKRAIVVNDAIAIRPMMDISLTFDHRLIDGALGARFLQRLKAHLESYETDMQL